MALNPGRPLRAFSRVPFQLTTELPEQGMQQAIFPKLKNKGRESLVHGLGSDREQSFLPDTPKVSENPGIRIKGPTGFLLGPAGRKINGSKASVGLWRVPRGNQEVSS